jgi:hypothetical protein
MREDITKLISIDRDEMSENEREMFLCDVKKVLTEYFECNEDISLQITRSKQGFIVCLIFSATRIKYVKDVN